MTIDALQLSSETRRKLGFFTRKKRFFHPSRPPRDSRQSAIALGGEGDRRITDAPLLWKSLNCQLSTVNCVRMTKLQLLSIGDDPIFRLGLGIACDRYPDLQVAAEAAPGTEALQLLEARSTASATAKPGDLVIFDWDTQNLPSGEMGLGFCQQLKSLYPNLPLLLLGGPPTAALLAAAQQAGASGYCPKGRDISLTIEAIRLVASGQTYWPADAVTGSQIASGAAKVTQRENSAAGAGENARNSTVFPPAIQNLLVDFGRSGLQQIDATLAAVKADLQDARATGATDLPSILDGVVLSGRRRELLAARWIVSQLLSFEEGRRKREEGRRKKKEGRRNKAGVIN
ncbi:MAG: response regulator transcription factor [Oscillatoriales cyanobacterium RU_3_3]|nr:response regulator transcription factor [Oscillatoriales cyanobacterium RU_3_3]